MTILKRIKRLLSQLIRRDSANDLKILAAQTLIRDNKNSKFLNVQEAEFKVFSQWGEDGIVQYLINKLPIENEVFVEFGVEDYTESNTRFLLENDNWSGLVMDGSYENIKSIKKSEIYWKYDLVAREVFITRDNIDPIIDDFIQNNNLKKEIGLLSVDIDGNDYFIWDAIKSIDPIIVICEYNSVFGKKHNCTIPYDEAFVRTKKHYSNLYFGASIQAVCKLAKSKGYEFIGTNKNSVNAFFVKKEYACKYVPELITTIEKSVSDSKFRESRDESGKLTFLSGKERIDLIRSMSIVDLDTSEIVSLENLSN